MLIVEILYVIMYLVGSIREPEMLLQFEYNLDYNLDFNYILSNTVILQITLSKLPKLENKLKL